MSRQLLFSITACLITALFTGCGAQKSTKLLDQGILAIESGHYPEAISALKSAAKISPTDSSVFLNLGIAHWKVKQLESALENLLKARDLRRNDARIFHHLGYVYGEMGNPEQSLQALISALDLSPRDPAINTSIAVLYMNSSSQHAVALGYLNDALGYDSGYAPAWYNLAVLQDEFYHDNKKALSFYSAYLKIAKGTPQIALVKKAIDRLSAAPTPLLIPPPTPTSLPTAIPTPVPPPASTNMLTSTDPANDAITPSAPPVEASLPDTPDTPGGHATTLPDPTTPANPPPHTPPHTASPETINLNTLLTDARLNIKRGDSDAALIALKRILATDPAHTEALWSLASLYETTKPREAIATYKLFMHSARTDSRIPDAQMRIQRLRKASPKASTPPVPTPKRMDRTTSQRPKMTLTHDSSGRPKVGTSSSTTAREAFHEASRFEQAGDIKQAIALYQTAVNLDPEFGTAYYNMGILYKKSNNYSEAEKALLHALRVDEQMLKAHYMLALVYWSQNKNENKALSHLDRILKTDETFTKAYYLKALIHNKAKRNKEALKAINALLVHQPDFADAHFLAGLLHLNLHHPLAETRKHYERYLSLSPTGISSRPAQAWLAQNP